MALVLGLLAWLLGAVLLAVPFVRGTVLLLIGLGYLGFREWTERAPATYVSPGADG